MRDCHGSNLDTTDTNLLDDILPSYTKFGSLEFKAMKCKPYIHKFISIYIYIYIYVWLKSMPY